MRYLVLTDIHANLEALDTCLADAAGRRLRPDARARRSRRLRRRSQRRRSSACRRSSPPRSCAAITTKWPAASNRPRFNVVAKSAALWTFEALTPEHRAWLAALPQGPIASTTSSRSATARRSTRTPTSSTSSTRCRALKASERPLCLFGHTHYQIVWEQSIGRARQPREHRAIAVDELRLTCETDASTW